MTDTSVESMVYGMTQNKKKAEIPETNHNLENARRDHDTPTGIDLLADSKLRKKAEAEKAALVADVVAAVNKPTEEELNMVAAAKKAGVEIEQEVEKVTTDITPFVHAIYRFLKVTCRFSNSGISACIEGFRLKSPNEKTVDTMIAIDDLCHTQKEPECALVQICDALEKRQHQDIKMLSALHREEME